MHVLFKSVILLLLISGIPRDPSMATSQDLQSKAIVVTLTQAGRKTVYEVNGLPTEDLLRALEDARKQFGLVCPVIVLADERTNVDLLRSVGGTAAKANLGNPRYFSLTADKQYMSEIVFKRYIPFSLNPPSD